MCALFYKIYTLCDNYSQITALKQAAEKGYATIINLLLEHYDEQISSHDKRIAYLKAQIYRHQAAVDVLLTNFLSAPLTLPKTMLKVINYLELHNGRFVDLHSADLEFAAFQATPDLIKLKHNDRREHSIMKDLGGHQYAIFRNGYIGKGSYGKVKIAQKLLTGEICAVKIQDKSVSSEIEMLGKYGDLLGYQIRDKKTGTKEYIFQKYIPGCTWMELFSLLKVFQIRLNPLEQLILVRNLLQSFKKLTENDIRHCDSHDENVMINPATLQTSIIDFGRSKASQSLVSIEMLYYDAFPDYFIDEVKNIVQNIATWGTGKKQTLLDQLNRKINDIDKLIQTHSEADPIITSSFKEFLQKDIDLIQRLNSLSSNFQPSSSSSSSSNTSFSESCPTISTAFHKSRKRAPSKIIKSESKVPPKKQRGHG